MDPEITAERLIELLDPHLLRMEERIMAKITGEVKGAVGPILDRLRGYEDPVTGLPRNGLATVVLNTRTELDRLSSAIEEEGARRQEERGRRERADAMQKVADERRGKRLALAVTTAVAIVTALITTLPEILSWMAGL